MPREMEIVAIGVNTHINKCCVIESTATFEQLKDDFDLYNTNIYATNWGGCDSVDRTLKEKRIEIGVENFKHNGRNLGIDFNHGHDCAYDFRFDTVYEIFKKVEEE